MKKTALRTYQNGNARKQDEHFYEKMADGIIPGSMIWSISGQASVERR